jgi:hypothetical protein
LSSTTATSYLLLQMTLLPVNWYDGTVFPLETID